jgi:hypothetical protein
MEARLVAVLKANLRGTSVPLNKIIPRPGKEAIWLNDRVPVHQIQPLSREITGFTVLNRETNCEMFHRELSSIRGAFPSERVFSVLLILRDKNADAAS